MKYRRLDDNWDYVFGHGKYAYVSGAEAVAQAVKTRLLLLYSEWWEDREDGLPLWERIIGSPGGVDNLKAIDYIFKERIRLTEGVQNIIGYMSEFDERRYVFKAALETEYGAIVVSNREDWE